MSSVICFLLMTSFHAHSINGRNPMPEEKSNQIKTQSIKRSNYFILNLIIIYLVIWLIEQFS